MGHRLQREQASFSRRGENHQMIQRVASADPQLDASLRPPDPRLAVPAAETVVQRRFVQRPCVVEIPIAGDIGAHARQVRLVAQPYRLRPELYVRHTMAREIRMPAQPRRHAAFIEATQRQPQFDARLVQLQFVLQLERKGPVQRLVSDGAVGQPQGHAGFVLMDQGPGSLPGKAMDRQGEIR